MAPSSESVAPATTNTNRASVYRSSVSKIRNNGIAPIRRSVSRLGRLRMDEESTLALSAVAFLSVDILDGKQLPQLPGHFARYEDSDVNSRFSIGFFYHFAAAAQ